MPDLLKFTVDVPVSPERAYRAWLDGGEHSRFTGKTARIQNEVGGTFSSMDGQVEGKILSMVPFDSIVQTWRKTDDPDGEEQQVELLFEPTCLGAQIVIQHTGEMDERSDRYVREWEIDYLRDLSRYFEEMIEGTAVDQDG